MDALIHLISPEIYMLKAYFIKQESKRLHMSCQLKHMCVRQHTFSAVKSILKYT